MLEIKDLISKLNNKLFSAEIKKEVIRKIISDEIKVEIPSDKLEIKNGTIFLDIKPIYKNEILLKKEKIWNKLNENFGNKTPENFL